MTDNPKPIQITVTSGAQGQALSIVNQTTGDKINTTVGVGGKNVIDLQNFENGYTEGDVVSFGVSGERVGSTTLTTVGMKPEVITISTAAITSGLSRGIR